MNKFKNRKGKAISRNQAKNLMSQLLEKLGLEREDINKRKLILTDKQFDEKIMSGVLKKDQIKSLSVSINYNLKKKKYEARIEVTGLAESRTVDLNDKDTVLIRDLDRICTRENFTWQSISVKLDEETNNKMGKTIFGGTIVVLYSKSGMVNVFVEKEKVTGSGEKKTVYFNIENNKDYNSLPDNTNIYKIMRFKLDPTTASGTRNKSGIFDNVTEKDNRFEKFNRATVGGLKKQRDMILELLKEVRTEEDFKEVKKVAKKSYGYLGNVSTASKDGGKPLGYHIYEGKIVNETSEYYLTEEFTELIELLNAGKMLGMEEYEIKEIERRMKKIQKQSHKLQNAATQDGQLYVNCLELAAMLYRKTGYVIDPRVLLGRMIQVRPATIKASAVVVSPKVYKALIKGAKELAGLNGTTVNHYGDEDQSLFIADRNCVKLDFEMEEEISFEILAFNRSSQGDGSKQLYKNVLCAAKKKGRLQEFVELIRELEKITIDEKIAKAIDSHKPARMVSPKDILNAVESGYTTNVLTAIAPSLLRESKPLLDSTYKQLVNSVVDCIDRMHGNLNVESRRLASDPTFILTGGRLEGVLKLGESFINSKKIARSVMFKYPVAGVEEQYPSRNAQMKEIIKTVKQYVKDGVIDDEQGDAIIEFFGSLKKTVRVLPALMYLANACAGLDFDYDGESSIIEVKEPKNRCEEITNKIVELLFDNGMRGVSINI